MPGFDFDRVQKVRVITKSNEKAKKTVPGGKRDLKIVIGIFGGLILLSVILLLL